MSYKVLIPEVEWEGSHGIIRQIASVVVGEHGLDYGNPRVLASSLVGVDGVIITSQHSIDSAALTEAPSLKVIAKYGAFPGDQVDLEAATHHGVVVCYTRGANAASVAEHTILLILAGLRQLLPAVQDLRAGLWRDLSRLGSELAGKTIGVLGCGECGREVIRRLAAFDVSVLGFDPHIPGSMIREMSASPVNLETVLRESDVLTLHASLTPETRHLIGAPELCLLKPTALLVNTARGGLIDEDALLAALRSGKLAGACLDVFAEEPVTSASPLLELDNVLGTPHIASSTAEAYRREASMAALAVRDVLEGRCPAHVANPDVLRGLSLAGGGIDGQRR